MTRQSSSLVRWLLACVFAAVGATAGEATQPQPKPSLYDELRREQAKLAELQARLERVRSGIVEPEPDVKPDPSAATEPAPPQEAPKDKAAAAGKPEPSTKTASTPLVARPSVAAADVLYRLGRYGQAREVYDALLARKGDGKDDRVWAGLQAGNCCRRLGDSDAAIAYYQAVQADYPDHPWTRGHVAWALKTAQWEKRWNRHPAVSSDEVRDASGSEEPSPTRRPDTLTSTPTPRPSSLRGE